MKQFVTIMLVSSILSTGGCAISRDSGALVKELRCEYLANPAGIDVAQPRLGWIIKSDERGQRQSAYQVLVASGVEKLAENKADLWNSGKVESDQSVHVVYAGKPMESGMECLWKVRVWDKDGKASKWSEPASWSMGLLQSGDWQAKWISRQKKELNEKPVALGKWVWHPTVKDSNEPIYFRNEINLPSGREVFSGRVVVGAGGPYSLYIDGKKVGDNNDIWVAKHFNIHSVAGMSPATFSPGRHCIAVKAKGGQAGFGLICSIRFIYKGTGEVEDIQLVDGWVCSDIVSQDWMTPEFKAEGWVKAEAVGNYGDKPWGKRDQWIDGPRRSFALRRGFSLPSKVTKATAYVSGLGWYDFYVNGQPVGRDLFKPGWTQYDKRIQYQTYDVTELMNKGHNAVGAILCNGWWSSGMAWSWADSRHALWNEDFRFIAQVEVDCADGSHHRIISDRNWKTGPSPVLEDTVYHGETYDARIEQTGWDCGGFDDSKWDQAVEVNYPVTTLCAQTGPTVQVTEELKAVNITEPVKGVYIYDFGQNHAGVCKLKVNAPAGTKITIRHAELMKDGRLDPNTNGIARATDNYICKGEVTEVWQPRFTYHGYRYAQLSGYPGKPDEDTLVSQVVYSAVEPTGEFECSNELLNKIFKAVVWTQKSNMPSVPTDCPQRHERMGFTGDGQMFAITSCWNMDMGAFYTKWTRDIRDTQLPDGQVPDVAPVMWRGGGCPGWADAVAIIPWTVYQFYGDKRILEQNYDAVKKFVEHRRTNSKGNLYEVGGYGDWLAVVESPKAPIGSAYYYYSTKLLGKMAAALGKEAEAKEYSELAEATAEAYNKLHLKMDKMQYEGGTQTANILPLAFGITPVEYRQTIAEKVANDIAGRDYHLSTGFLGTPLLLPTLTEYGQAEMAYKVAASDTQPSLGYMIKEGATTIWEMWSGAYNSRNHFTLGSEARWYFEALAGINIDPQKPGFKNVIIHPRPVGDVTFARVSYKSLYGNIGVLWKKEGKIFQMEVNIPANATATVLLPAKDVKCVSEGGKDIDKAEGVKLLGTEGNSVACQIGSGTYRFKVESIAGE